MTVTDLVFLVFAAICAVAAWLAVLAKSVIHAGLWLGLCLVALAGCYLILGAETLALVQVLIYVGAVVVLVVFAMVVTRTPLSATAEVDHSRAGRLSAAGLALAGTGLILGVLGEAVRGAQISPDRSSGEVANLAESLFGIWALPFELLSVLLLAALIGALVLTRSAAGRR